MVDFDNRRELLIKYVEGLDEENVIKLSSELLDAGTAPLDLLEIINEGMKRVGSLYESKEYYIADLIMAGLIFKQVLDLEKMTAHFHTDECNKIGKVIIGTVKGDIHDIGKDIFVGMMETNGFHVIDLGVDVDKEVFIKKVIEHQPDIVGLSGVLTYTVESMKEVVEALKEAGLREQVKVILGGNHLTKESCLYAGADNFANEATIGVKVCREWIKDSVKQGVTNNV